MMASAGVRLSTHAAPPVPLCPPSTHRLSALPATLLNVRAFGTLIALGAISSDEGRNLKAEMLFDMGKFNSDSAKRAFVERQTAIIEGVTGVPASPATFESENDPRNPNSLDYLHFKI
jgi:hypothetical protein